MRKVFIQPFQLPRLLLLFGDMLIVFVSSLLILFLSKAAGKPFPEDISKFPYISFVFSTITVWVYYILDLYNIPKRRNSGMEFTTFCIGMITVMILYSSLSYLLSSLRPGKTNLLLFAIGSGILTFIWHNSLYKIVTINQQRILFIGQEKIIKDITQYIKDNYSQFYTIVGHWHSNSHNPTLPNLFDFIEEHNADLVIYSVHSKVLKQVINDLITVKFSKKNIINAYDFYQDLTRKYPIYHLNDFWLLVNSQKEIFLPTAARNLKRAFDLLLFMCLLPLAVPLFLVSALAIKLFSKGPVFYLQERVGLDEVPFKIFKLRTMIVEAEESGPQMCKDNDCRITKVGKILRFFRLDELPQLINVLKGEMSFVGPRPLRKPFTDQRAQLIPFYRLRFLVKPGITGWAQVSYGHGNTMEDHRQMFQYDMFYIVRQSLWLDLFIIFKTIQVILRGKGSR